jgi:hypothetical protein
MTKGTAHSVRDRLLKLSRDRGEEFNFVLSLAAILNSEGVPFLTERDVRFACMYTQMSSPEYEQGKAIADELTAEGQKLKLGY